MPEPDDEALMERFRGGDERAFDALFTRYAPPIRAFLTRLVGDRTLADDLFQVTFLSVVRSRDRFERGAKFAPWLFSIAANAARDALRRRQRSPLEDGTTAAVEAGITPTMSDPPLAARMSAALLKLPLQQREAVLLHKVFGWTFEEIAVALDSNTATIRVRAHRGTLALQGLLEDVWESV